MNALLRVLSIPAQVLSKVPGLAPVIRACSTSVGQKVVMAITGLSLCGFLVAHLAGNLQLFAGENVFNEYAHKLHSLGPILAAAEIGLFATFAFHIGLAISTGAMNRAARGRAYAVKESKQGYFIIPGGAFSWMVVTGFVILAFLIIHIIDMKFRKGFGVDYQAAMDSAGVADSEFQAVRAVLSHPAHALIYLVSLVALGIHLSHGVRSALQTLGVHHKNWNFVLRWAGFLFAWAIAGGFISLIAWAFASRG